MKLSINEKAALVNACVFWMNEFPDAAERWQAPLLQKLVDKFVSDRSVIEAIFDGVDNVAQ